MIDLHLHSAYSDGDLTVAELAHEVKQRGMGGFSLTDHNGVWGVSEAKEVAAALGLTFIEGIEISTHYQGVDVHILGYARMFKTELLNERLAATRRGYLERVSSMIKRCQEQGFAKLSIEAVLARHSERDPCLVSYDVARELQRAHGLSVTESHRMTVKGGKCYVPYGSWALTPQQAISILHDVGAVAVLAHPGTIETEAGKEFLSTILAEITMAGLDGIEVRHPFHSRELTEILIEQAKRYRLLSTAGSDWHGPSRFSDSNAQFGHMGITAAEWEALARATAS